MDATVLHAPGDIRLEQVPDPQIIVPTDAVVRTVASCVCGSDLWPYRGVSKVTRPRRIGHEFIGVVEEVGAQVDTLRAGDFVVVPFLWSDNTCPHCTAGMTSACAHGGGFGGPDRDGHLVDGCQGEYVRVPQADGTLVATPEQPDEAMLPSLLTLTDVLATGWHAAVSARVREGQTVVVVGDGAVGLCGVLSAVQQGATRVIAVSRHADRQAIATQFGATDIVPERGEEGVARVMELTDGVGADAVLECVGTKEAMDQAFASARPGATVGFVGVPYGAEPPIREMFGRNVGLAGGMAPVRAYLDELLPMVWDGQINPGAVFDQVRPLAEVADAYRAMDERTAIKVMLRP